MSEDRQIHYREVAVQVAEGDGRTLVARLIPYNEVATVNDGQGPYQEMFVPGAFNAQLNAASRIKAFLNFRHLRGGERSLKPEALSDIIGHASKIEDHPDGLHGELRVLKGADGDKALELVREGMLDGLSIEFESYRDKRVNGIVQRHDARLLGIALTPVRSYTGAEVLAMREQTLDIPWDELKIPPPDPQLLASLRGYGVNVPEVSG